MNTLGNKFPNFSIFTNPFLGLKKHSKIFLNLNKTTHTHLARRWSGHSDDVVWRGARWTLHRRRLSSGWWAMHRNDVVLGNCFGGSVGRERKEEIRTRWSNCQRGQLLLLLLLFCFFGKCWGTYRTWDFDHWIPTCNPNRSFLKRTNLGKKFVICFIIFILFHLKQIHWDFPYIMK